MCRPCRFLKATNTNILMLSFVTYAHTWNVESMTWTNRNGIIHNLSYASINVYTTFKRSVLYEGEFVWLDIQSSISHLLVLTIPLPISSTQSSMRYRFDIQKLVFGIHVKCLLCERWVYIFFIASIRLIVSICLYMQPKLLKCCCSWPIVSSLNETIIKSIK